VPAFDVASHLAAALDAAGVAYAIGGAIALGAFADPRGTHDVDINLFVDHAGLDGALDVLVAAGVTIDRAAARNADQDGDVVVGHYEGMRVDLFTPSIPFAWEAMKTRRRLAGPSGEAWYLSPESTAVFKLLFFRPKDRLDVEKLVAVQGGDLDRGYIRRWIVDMMGTADERVQAWDEIVARVG
jgi:hypothetical protein